MLTRKTKRKHDIDEALYQDVRVSKRHKFKARLGECLPSIRQYFAHEFNENVHPALGAALEPVTAAIVALTHSQQQMQQQMVQLQQQINQNQQQLQQQIAQNQQQSQHQFNQLQQ